MPTILGANSVSDTGYDVDNSIRFEDGSSDNLSRTPSSSGNRKTWTFSIWIKRSELGRTQNFFSAGTNNQNYTRIQFNSDDTIYIAHVDSAATTTEKQTTQKFRDISSWMHVVWHIDTTQSTASNREKFYVNGTQVTDFSTNTIPAEDYQSTMNEDVAHHIGTQLASYEKCSCYFAEVVFIDGQALTPSSFGEFDDDSPRIWKPKDVSGLTFGTNGFYLEFKQSGTSQNSSGLGADTSGNDHHFAVSNLTSIDQTTDTCTNNFITLNPLILETNRTNSQTYSEGNTIVIPDSHDNYATASSTIGLKGAGKWYWEAQIVWNGTASNAYYPRTVGFITHDYAYSASYLNQDEESWAIIYQAGGGPGWRIGHANSESNISGAGTMADGDTMIFALDLDNGKFYAGRNGTFFTSGDPTSGATGTGALATLDATDLSKFLFPAVTNASNATYYKFNFGNPAYSISSGNSDENGFGNFEYSVPSGYLAICSKNLGENG